MPLETQMGSGGQRGFTAASHVYGHNTILLPSVWVEAAQYRIPVNITLWQSDSGKGFLHFIDSSTQLLYKAQRRNSGILFFSRHYPVVCYKVY